MRQLQMSLDSLNKIDITRKLTANLILIATWSRAPLN